MLVTWRKKLARCPQYRASAYFRNQNRDRSGVLAWEYSEGLYNIEGDDKYVLIVELGLIGILSKRW